MPDENRKMSDWPAILFALSGIGLAAILIVGVAQRDAVSEDVPSKVSVEEDR